MTALEECDRDRFTHSESIFIEAPPQQVWDVVTDIKRTGEWSPVCRECWWAEPASGPEAGAWFHGRNESGDRVWETKSLVTVAEQPTEFTWLVGGAAVRWSFTLAPEGNGTSLTESWQVQDKGYEFFDKIYGDDAQTQLELRRDDALSGIPATLATIKQVVEAAR